MQMCLFQSIYLVESIKCIIHICLYVDNTNKVNLNVINEKRLIRVIKNLYIYKLY